MEKILRLLYNKSSQEYFIYLNDIVNQNAKKFVITVNPETIIESYNNKILTSILTSKNNSLVADGIAVVKKANKLGIEIKERITGIEIAKELLMIANKNKKSIYLFGSTEGVINNLVNMIKEKYPNINILGYSNGYVDNKDKVFEKIKKLSPDICMVALGIPQQELLINKHLKDFNKGVFIGVGGSFDVLSGHKKRAPKLFIKLNLEWLYRIICEPKRLKRFFKYNVKFMLKNKPK